MITFKVAKPDRGVRPFLLIRAIEKFKFTHKGLR